jgi:molybdopterin synthase sulfur carrier subunit
MKLLYFAWLRERIGTAQEDVTPPAEVATVAALLDWLMQRGPAYALALANPTAIRVAVNQRYSRGDAAVAPGDEIALFPPVTGG